MDIAASEGNGNTHMHKTGFRDQMKIPVNRGQGFYDHLLEVYKRAATGCEQSHLFCTASYLNVSQGSVLVAGCDTVDRNMQGT